MSAQCLLISEYVDETGKIKEDKKEDFKESIINAGKVSYTDTLMKDMFIENNKEFLETIVGDNNEPLESYLTAAPECGEAETFSSAKIGKNEAAIAALEDEGVVGGRKRKTAKKMSKRKL